MKLGMFSKDLTDAQAAIQLKSARFYLKIAQPFVSKFCRWSAMPVNRDARPVHSAGIRAERVRKEVVRLVVTKISTLLLKSQYSNYYVTFIRQKRLMRVH